MSLIFLIGMPGVGKSHWARIWAESASFDFADLDEFVEAQAGIPIPGIFHSVGEAGFRALESAVLTAAIAAAKGRNTIIAAGGGTPAFGDNMDTMLRAGCVVYLRARTKTLLKHIAGSESLRPLLQHADLDEAALEAMLERREPFYQRAHITIAVEKVRTDTFAQILNECTSRPS